MSNLGNKCHFSSLKEERMQMAAAITSLDGEILFSNTGNSKSNGWVISGIKTYKTRFWAAGSCTIVLTANNYELVEGIPKFPNYLSPEKQFCIYLGWIDSLREITISDLKNNYLLRDFIGVVDTTQFSGTGQGGATIKIEARDRMKWLLDSEVFYTTSESFSKDTNVGRSTIIWDIARKSIGIFDDFTIDGQIDESDNEDDEVSGPRSSPNESDDDVFKTCSKGGCGIDIKRPDPSYLVDITLDSDLADSDEWYKNRGPLSGKTENQELDISPNPEFRIFTTRAVNDESQQEAFLMTQQYPIEMIRFLSFQEVYPTEVFQHIDGNFYYVPRNVDSSALKNPSVSEDTRLSALKENGDPKRFYRTYYYKINPKNTVANENQKLINFREERSTLTTKTNFLVEHTNDTDQNATSFFYHLRAIPFELSDHPGFACKFKRINDPSLKTSDEAAMVAIAAARRAAKEARVGMMTTIGDPSFTPGEAVQVFGSPYIDNGGLDQSETDRSKFFSFKNRTGGWDSLIKEYSQRGSDGVSNENSENDYVNADGDGKVPLAEENLEADFVTPKDDTNNSYLCENISSIREKDTGEETTFGEEPPTIFRVEAIVQKFNLGSEGFTTEIALVSPF